MNAAGRRFEDRSLLTKGGTYVADVRDPLLDGAVAVHFVRSDVAHADIEAIDTALARCAPGVVGVFTAEDVDLGPLPPVLPRFSIDLSPPVLADGRVRHVGEPIVAVVAETPAVAADAAELVHLHLHPRPPVVDVVDALQSSTVVARQGDSNVVSEMAVGASDVEEMIDHCEVVVRSELHHARVAACPLEARAAASAWCDGRLHHWVSTQGPHNVKRVLVAMFGGTEDSVRVVAPDVGGGFGPKFANFPEDVMVAWIARRIGRPARWVETRRESMLALHHGRAQRQRVALGGTRTGAIAGYHLDIVQDAGAYASLGAYAPEATMRMATGVYRIPHARAEARSVLTTTTPVSAYRGTGRPEATCAIERAVDLFARAVGKDPVEVRLQNLVAGAEMPYRSAVGTVYDSGDYRDVLLRACAAVRYDDVRAEQRARRSRGGRVHLGIGVCSYVESTAAGPPMEFAAITIDAAGAATIASGSSPHGQSHVTTWTNIVRRFLGIAPERVRVLLGDTDRVALGLGTFASRSAQLAGSAIVRASEELVESAKAVAADRLEANASDIVFDPANGSFFVAGTPGRTLCWADVAGASAHRALHAQAMFTGAMTFPFGAHVAIVEVDEETGQVVLLRHVAVDDAGTLLQPSLAEGQVHGGIAQGVGEALFEEFRHDARGTPLTVNLVDYAMPSAAELPFFEVAFTETPATSNPLGAKGIGESGTIGAVAAIQNAVCDALAHLGVRHIDLPMTPERVWRAICDARVSDAPSASSTA